MLKNQIQINYKLLYFLILIPYVIGLFLPVMELDSAQHATMAMRIAKENDFLNLIKLHRPYLDKPHMHYWLAALSFKFFGISEFTYRLPSFLFLLLGAFSTFNLGKLLYNSTVGHIATLIFLASQTIILSAHDVRTDAVLTGATIFSIWKLTSFIKTQSFWDIILGSVFLGIAFSTKGIIAVVVVVFCILCYLLYNREWKQILTHKVDLGIMVFLASIIPVLYAYYYQFDSHPELVVKGQQNVSGVKFIVWDQVFNRLNANGFNETSPDYFFFFHTLLWTFLPFSIIAYIALFVKSKEFIKLKFKKEINTEFLTLGGFFSVLLLISFSKFKLPHYLNILIPILAILTAHFLCKLVEENKQKLLKASLIIQYVITLILIVAALLLSFFVFDFKNYFLGGISIVGLLFIIRYYFEDTSNISKIVTLSVITAAWVNFNLNIFFYPNLLEYQGGKQLAEIVKKEQIPLHNIYLLKPTYSWSFDFYTQQNTPVITEEELIKNTSEKWVVFYNETYKSLQEKNIKFKQIHQVDHFRVTRLSGKFINKKTRVKTLQKMYLAKF